MASEDRGFTPAQQRRGGNSKPPRYPVRYLTDAEVTPPTTWTMEPQRFPLGWQTTAHLNNVPATLTVLATRCELPHGLRDASVALRRRYQVEMRCGLDVRQTWVSQKDMLAKFAKYLQSTTESIKENQE